MKAPVLVLGLLFCPLLTICRGQHAVEQPYHFWGTDINVSSPIGQTFTALDPRISTIGFYLQNVRTAPATITYQLFAGEGSGGPSLGLSTFEVPGLPLDDWYDRDFSSITLVPGQIYTVMISEMPTDNCMIYAEQWAYSDGSPIPGTVDYTGGHMLSGGWPLPPYMDLTFRVVPVPEPNSLVLMMIGAGLCFSRRKCLMRSSYAA